MRDSRAYEHLILVFLVLAALCALAMLVVMSVRMSDKNLHVPYVIPDGELDVYPSL